jgi:potassium/sodium efflux P-type ATPase
MNALHERAGDHPPENNITQTIHTLSVEEVFRALGSDARGLSADEVATRLAQHGKNVIRKIKGKPLIVRFLSNFVHLMAILLWIAGAVALVAKMPQLAIAVWLVNVINGLFSFFQEYRAEKATEALRQMLPDYARVIRDGQEQRILAEELVPGDIILLSEGDRISSDARLVDDSDLRVSQSTLTGESNPVHKSKAVVLRADLNRAERSNLVFAGTSVASGSGMAVVFSTGMNTEFGKIAGLTQAMKEDLSPLQKEMARVTKLVSIMAVSVGIFFFLLAILLAGVDVAESFIFSMGMIVAFIPEGLLPTVTLALAMSVQRMAKRHALIKRMSAVETLGCTTVICTVKTGTLTQNEMTVSNLWLPSARMNVTGVGYAPEGTIVGEDASSKQTAELEELLAAAGLCNNARLIPPDGETPRWAILGDPTEAAMLVAARKVGIDLGAREDDFPRVRELPFDSSRKRMSTIHDGAAGKRVAYIKGSPKEVLELCSAFRNNGSEQPMDGAFREKIMAANDEYARNGLRVLAVTRRELDTATLPRSLSDYTPEMIEKDLTFLGLIAMADPPRIEVASAVEECRRAGIRIIMITGDYGLTAESIARRVGIVRGENVRVLTGVDLEKISDTELKQALGGEVIFARVAPEQKLRVVSALQEMGHIVAVTGDGVNDSPALKKADIGVAMGLSGTDVAKEAADMILTDDNFASIVHAVEEGRTVYNNIRRFATYILNSNVPEAVPFVVFLFSRGLVPLPLTVMQVLAIDLGTDMVPAIGLGAEKPEAGVMNHPPRPQKERLLSRALLMRAFLWYGIIESAVAMLAYFFLNSQYGWPGAPLAETGVVYRMATMLTFAAIVFCQIGVVFACRTNRASLLSVGFFSNRMVLIGIACELTLLCLLSYLPFLHGIFNTAPLGWKEWLFLLIWPPIILLLDEARKALLRRREQKAHQQHATI